MSKGSVCRGAAAAVLLIALFTVVAGRGQGPRLGGCQTTTRAYGLPALRDSVAMAAGAELMAPGSGPKTGPACRALGVDTPLFAQVGALDSLTDETWRSVAAQVTIRMAAAGVHLAERTGLQHTTGTCFPPYHVDFRACADSSAARRFLVGLTASAWEGFTVTENRRERRLFVTAGLSLQLMDTALDLK